VSPETVKIWLRKKKSLGFAQNAAFGVVALLAGLVILFLTFWFTYAVIYTCIMGVSAVSELVLNKRVHLGHTGRLIGSDIFILLLFFQHFRTDSSHWGDYPKRDYPIVPGLGMRAGLFGGLGLMLAYPGASANMVADILLSGPRLVVGSWGMFKRALTLKRMDENGCGELLTFLWSKTGVVPYDDLKSAGWEVWFPEMHCIDGVNFLQQGLTLSGELRTELNALAWP